MWGSGDKAGAPPDQWLQKVFCVLASWQINTCPRNALLPGMGEWQGGVQLVQHLGSWMGSALTHTNFRVE